MFSIRTGRVPFFDDMKKVVVGQDVSGARSCGAGRSGAGRHWGNIPGAKRRGAGG